METKIKENHITLTYITLTLKSRWPIEQISETEFNVKIPTGGRPLINESVAQELGLSESEFEAANEAALRTIVIVK